MSNKALAIIILSMLVIKDGNKTLFSSQESVQKRKSKLVLVILLTMVTDMQSISYSFCAFDILCCLVAL
ncbi:uncharacterized protein B0P05DRAFT_525099, partial [Gilbertella persicaria]|uniref:uncharacterized protein n=1 Tax=Gilbertella persicaria TaxID=101096 RepID=UPI00221F08B9